MKLCSKCRVSQPLQNFYFTNGAAWSDCKLCSSHAIKFAPNEKVKLKETIRVSRNTVNVENE